MKKILFATEFSSHAPEVFKFAADLAYFFKARLAITHAFGNPEKEILTNRTLEEREGIVIDKMIDFVTTNIPEDYRTSIEIEYVPKVGFPADAVLEVALDEEVDLIVMGMTGETNAMSTLLGTTTLTVLNKSEFPVLIVPATAIFSGIDNIVYTTNFEFRDLTAINYLKNWAKIFDAPIHCLHVFEQDENEMHVRKNLNTLKETYQGEKMISFEIIQGDFKEEIEQFATRKSADIVVMTAHKRNFISRMVNRSAVQGVARNIHLPLLVIKDNAFEFNNNDLVGWINLVQSIG